MKITFFLTCSLLLAGFQPINGVRTVAGGDRTIGKIVKLLQEMLEKANEAAEQERVLYAKYRCYVDTNTKEKTESIEKLTKQISLLENEIQALQGENGQLSTALAQLQTDMASNERERQMADSLREKQKEAFEAEETDIKAALEQMGKAIDVLAAMGADQNLLESDDHAQFMAGYNSTSLLRTQSKVRGASAKVSNNLRKVGANVEQALLAAGAFLSKTQQDAVKALLQEKTSPQTFTIVGVLKSLKDTFETNLKNAQDAETKGIESHAAFVSTKQSEWDTMDAQRLEKEGSLSGNDLAIGTKKGELATAIQQKADAEEFLATLKDMAATKAKEYDARTMYRTTEQAAISEAIAILDSDKAFHTFKKVAATSTGATSLLQVRARDANREVVSSEVRSVIQALRATGTRIHSRRLAGVAGLISAKNPFALVLEKIEEIKKMIDKEAKVDKEQLDWCGKETEATSSQLEAKKEQITTLDTDITNLNDRISNPTTGLEAMIQQSEEDLELNQKNQAEATEIRKKDNALYQQQAEDASEAAVLLDRAIKALEKYYTDLEARYKKELEGFVQEDPAPPETWSETYAGQGTQGNNVIAQLTFVLTETKKEEEELHNDERAEQEAYEEAMAGLKTEEENLQTQIVTQKKDLADAQEELEAKKVELATTEKEKASIEKYIESIKPGCDFITENYSVREANRGEELAALDTALEKLKATPAFASAAENDKHQAAYGECTATCVKSGEATAKCKACMAGASVQSYCASHPSTAGC